MQSRILVAFAVIGCLYAVHAKVHHFDDNLDVAGFVPKGPINQLETQKLLRLSYHKLFTLLDNLSETEIQKLREYMTDFGRTATVRMLGIHDDVIVKDILKTIDENISKMNLKDFVKALYYTHAKLINVLSEKEIEKLREIAVKFVDDVNPDLMHYIETGYELVVDPRGDETEVDHNDESFYIKEHDRVARNAVAVVEEKRSIKDLLKEVIRKLRELRERVWEHKKIEVTNAIIKIIKDADEELIKNNHKDEVDQLLARTPYEKLSELTIRQLSKEAGYRAEFLLKHFWEDNVVDVKSALVYFLDVIEKRTAELNQNRIE